MAHRLHCSYPFIFSRCIICQEGEESGRLHLVQTMQVSDQFKYYALHVSDPLLRVRLSTSAADAIAGDVVYHNDCRTMLERKVRQTDK